MNIDIMLGDMRPFFEGRIIVHDSKNKSSLDYLGETSRGTPVWINKKLSLSERIICINSVEPHFFAGFTGGRKSLIPGLAGFDTTVANHSHAKHEDAKSLNLASNPVHLDLEEAVSFIKGKNIFSIQLVTSRQGEIVDLFCGILSQSFRDACDKARDVYTVDIENKYDIVFAIGEPPLDINLYQLQKGQEHGAEAVKDDGILIVVGACNEGSGSDYFINLASGLSRHRTRLFQLKPWQTIASGYTNWSRPPDGCVNIKIWYVTKLDDSLISKVYFSPKSSMQAALDEALEIKGPRRQNCDT